MANMDYYDRLTERFTLDNTPLLLSAAASFAIGYLQYIYAIRLTLREGEGPIPFWLHLFYLAHDSTWSFVLGRAAPLYDNHWFLRGTSAALFIWTILEIWCIHRSITKNRDVVFAPILGPNHSLGSVLLYTVFMQAGMYCVVVILILFMGEGSVMQWFSLTNVLIIMGPVPEYTRRGSREGLALGLCLVNIACAVMTFAPFSFWALAMPEIFDQPAYQLIGCVMFAISVWAYFIVASYPPKKREKYGPVPIW